MATSDSSTGITPSELSKIAVTLGVGSSLFGGCAGKNQLFQLGGPHGFDLLLTQAKPGWHR